jgi:hypothetical protein
MLAATVTKLRLRSKARHALLMDPSMAFAAALQVRVVGAPTAGLCVPSPAAPVLIRPCVQLLSPHQPYA